MTDSDDKLHALYARARAEEAPSLEDRRAVKRAVLGAAALAGATAAATTATAAAAVPAPLVSALTLGKIASALGVGLALGAVASSGAIAVHAALAPEAPAPSSRAPITARAALTRNGVSPQPEPPRAAISRSAGAPEGAAAAESAGAPETMEFKRSQPAAGPAVRSAALPVAPVNSSLAAETRALAEVQSELSNGDAARALTLLTEQEVRFANGALGEERAAARVVVLCASGRTEAAHRARSRFLDEYPRSPLVKRVLAACAEP